MITYHTKVLILKLKFLLISLFFTLNLFGNEPLKKVSVQLEWKHQFEFAGFYVAQEKGYYKEIGLDVEFKEFDKDVNISEEVLSGKSTFGISSSALILERLNNKPVVLLASYFKQNALALVVKPEIKKIKDLSGKKIMALDWEVSNTSLGVMLKENKINKEDFTLIEHTYSIDKFVNGEVDAMSIFLTSQLHDLDKLGIKYKIFNP